MVTDATGRNFEKVVYKRIVSLVPSITKTLFDIGCNERIVGVTNYCILPFKAQKKKKVGGTKNAKYDRIISCDPDLIIVNKEENSKELVEALRQNVDVFVTYPKRFEDNITLLKDLGKLLNVEVETWINKLRNIEKWKGERKLVFCPIWKKPWMSINMDTYIDNVLDLIGFDNICKEFDDRYPVVNLENLNPPDIIILPDEPYHFREKDVRELRKSFPQSKFCLTDGKLLSWYGTYATNVYRLFDIHGMFQTNANDTITIG